MLWLVRLTTACSDTNLWNAAQAMAAYAGRLELTFRQCFIPAIRDRTLELRHQPGDSRAGPGRGAGGAVGDGGRQRIRDILLDNGHRRETVELDGAPGVSGMTSEPRPPAAGPARGWFRRRNFRPLFLCKRMVMLRILTVAMVASVMLGTAVRDTRTIRARPRPPTAPSRAPMGRSRVPTDRNRVPAAPSRALTDRNRVPAAPSRALTDRNRVPAVRSRAPTDRNQFRRHATEHRRVRDRIPGAHSRALTDRGAEFRRHTTKLRRLAARFRRRPTCSDASQQSSGGAQQSADGSQQSSGTSQGSSDGTQTSSDGSQTGTGGDPAAALPGGDAVDRAAPLRSLGTACSREVRLDAPVNQRNCWVQGMIDGQVIRGDLLAERVTYVQAQCVSRWTRGAASARTSARALPWSARAEQNSPGGSDPWSGNAVGTGDPNLNTQGWTRVHAYPGRARHGNWSNDGTDPNPRAMAAGVMAGGGNGGSGYGGSATGAPAAASHPADRKANRIGPRSGAPATAHSSKPATSPKGKPGNRGRARPKGKGSGGAGAGAGAGARGWSWPTLVARWSGLAGRSAGGGGGSTQQ